MNHIDVLKNVKTFEELLTVRDELNLMISEYNAEFTDKKGYHEYQQNCLYRNMIDKRIDYLISRGAKIDQVEIEISDNQKK